MKRAVFFLAIILCPYSLLFSQSDESEETPSKNTKGAKGFHAGIYLGSLFANKYSAKVYDGYGYDENCMKNNFAASFMNRRINFDYGGGNGQPDQVAQALGVNHGEWTFDGTDMPSDMKYSSTMLLGVQLHYGITKKDALLLNVNTAKITASGNFTIVITNPNIGPQQPGYENIKTFSITGSEQRILFQIGYRRILGEPGALNFFIEAGAGADMVKYLRNQASINNLQVDLSFYYNSPYYTTYRLKCLRGTSFGTFAGMGLNLSTNPKWTLQALYSPSLEKINIGASPKTSLQNALGIRAFYNL